MIEEKKMTLGDMTFLLRPLSPFKAVILDKKVVLMIAPLLNGLKDGIDSKIDIPSVISGLTESLGKVNDVDFKNLIVDLFYGVAYMPAGKTPVELNAGTIDNVFCGDFGKIYDLMYKVMEFNKFTPFRMVAGGQFQEAISGLLNTKQKAKQKKKQ